MKEVYLFKGTLLSICTNWNCSLSFCPGWTLRDCTWMSIPSLPADFQDTSTYCNTKAIMKKGAEKAAKNMHVFYKIKNWEQQKIMLKFIICQLKMLTVNIGDTRGQAVPCVPCEVQGSTSSHGSHGSWDAAQGEPAGTAAVGSNCPCGGHSQKVLDVGRCIFGVALYLLSPWHWCSTG